MPWNDHGGGSVAPTVAPSGGWNSQGGAGSQQASAPKKSGGGGIGGFFHRASHFVGQKADLAAHDIQAIPTGLVQAGGAIAHDSAKIQAKLGSGSTSGRGPWQTPALGKAVAKQTVTSVKHPLRDPFQTGLNALAVLSAGAGGVARVGAAADAARVGELGDAAKALVVKPTMPPRVLRVPKLVAPEGEGPAALAHEPVQLHAAQAPLARGVQAAHDRIVQRSLDRNVSAAEPTRTANYANRRVGKVTSEIARRQQRTSAVPAEMLARSGRSFDKGVSPKAGQLALFLRSANVGADEAARYWAGQAARGVNPSATSKLAKLAQQVHDQGILRLGDDGKIGVDAARFPALGKVDSLVKENQASREGIIRERGLMTPEGAANRLALVAERMGSEAARSDITGVREGQGYTPLRTTAKRSPLGGIARGRTPVIGKPRFSVGKEATGGGVAKGLVPDNTTAGVARANREALRYLGTVQHRGIVSRYGSDVRRTGNDVLVADPTATKLGPIPANTDTLLGRSKSTLNTISEDEHKGLAAAFQARLQEAIPGLGDKFAADRAEQLGARAPAGYKWVPHDMLGELVHEVTPRTGLTKGINNVNSAVTAMTVYFKLSHIPQRLTTNATTSLISGALRRGPITDAIKMRKALSDQEYAEAVAASGTHGYLALPHEGVGHVAQLATKGANFYAHRIDSPFRFLNLVHEAAKMGYKTPEQFRELLAEAKNPGTAADAMKAQYVLARANRVSMMYDGLGANEQRTIARALWFYPWTKAAVRFGGHVAGEHPFQAAALGQAGASGRQEQNQVLGDLPSYEYALTPFGGGTHPETSNFSVLSPFGTVGSVAEGGARPFGLLSGSLNPVYAGGASAIADALAGKTNQKALADLLGSATAPTPEAQILAAHRHPSKPTQIFQKTPLGALERSVGGPSLPRKTNKAALNKAAARERAGK